MFGEQFGECICGYWGLKGLERVDCSTKDIINQQLGTLSNDDGDGYGDVT